MINFSNSQENYYLKNYHPCRYRGEENNDFDEWSNQLLCLKNQNQNVVYLWTNEILKYLNNETFAIAVVPSSSSENKLSGINLVAQQIAKSTQNIVDATSCLTRYRSIDKLASGGNRETSVHLASIRVIDFHLIKDKNVLLIDDISTTGNSLSACKELLLKAGADQVKCLALGKTVRYHSEHESGHEEIERDAVEAHYRIEMWAEYEHELIETNAAQNRAEIEMWAEYEHEQVEEDHEDHEYADEWHEQIDIQATEAHNVIDGETEYKHEQVNEKAYDEHHQVEYDVAYAHEQVEVGADYAHLELSFLQILS